MHELTLARSLTEMVDEYASSHGAKRVKALNVRLGTLSAMTRALYFCFEPASRGTSCEGAILNIEEIPITVFCDSCNEIKIPTGRFSFRCSTCGMATPNLVTGREMQLVSIELHKEEAGHNHAP